MSKKVHSLIFMGVDNTKLHAFFDGKVANIEDARSMEEAVAKAYKMLIREIRYCSLLVAPASTCSRAMRIGAISSRLAYVICNKG